MTLRDAYYVGQMVVLGAKWEEPQGRDVGWGEDFGSGRVGVVAGEYCTSVLR
jgi:hypothetical protein